MFRMSFFLFSLSLLISGFFRHVNHQIVFSFYFYFLISFSVSSILLFCVLCIDSIQSKYMAIGHIVFSFHFVSIFSLLEIELWSSNNNCLFHLTCVYLKRGFRFKQKHKKKSENRRKEHRKNGWFRYYIEIRNTQTDLSTENP